MAYIAPYKRNTDELPLLAHSELSADTPDLRCYMYVVPELVLSASMQEIVKCKQNVNMEILFAYHS